MYVCCMYAYMCVYIYINNSKTKISSNFESVSFQREQFKHKQRQPLNDYGVFFMAEVTPRMGSPVPATLVNVGCGCSSKNPCPMDTLGG